MSKRTLESLLVNIANPIRLRILYQLDRERPLPFNDLMRKLGLDPTKDAGKFGYHLKMLSEEGLIAGGSETGHYLTNLGIEIIKILEGVKTKLKIKPEPPETTPSLNVIELSNTLHEKFNIPEEMAMDLSNLIVNVYRIMVKKY